MQVITKQKMARPGWASFSIWAMLFLMGLSLAGHKLGCYLMALLFTE